MEEEFRAILRGDAGVMALASGVDWGSHPQGASFPAVVLTVVSGAGDHTLDGPDGIFRGRVQVDCYALTYAAAKRLARAVVAACDGYVGGGFQGIFWASSRDSRESSYSEAAERPFRTSLDFLIVHSA